MSEDLLPIAEIKNPDNLKPARLTQYLNVYGSPVTPKGKPQLVAQFIEIQKQFTDFVKSPEGKVKDPVGAFRKKIGGGTGVAPTNPPPLETIAPASKKRTSTGGASRTSKRQKTNESQSASEDLSHSEQEEEDVVVQQPPTGKTSSKVTKRPSTHASAPPQPSYPVQAPLPAQPVQAPYAFLSPEQPRIPPTSAQVPFAPSTTPEETFIQRPPITRPPPKRFSPDINQEEVVEEISFEQSIESPIVPLSMVLTDRYRLAPKLSPAYTTMRESIKAKINQGQEECMFELSKDRMKVENYKGQLRIAVAQDVEEAVKSLIHFDRLRVSLVFVSEQANPSWVSSGSSFFGIIKGTKAIDFDKMVDDVTSTVYISVDLRNHLPGTHLYSEPIGPGSTLEYLTNFNGTRWSVPFSLDITEPGEIHLIQNVNPYLYEPKN